MIPFQYIWLVWSSAFLIPWFVLFLAFSRHRRPMVWAGLYEHFTWRRPVP